MLNRYIIKDWRIYNLIFVNTSLVFFSLYNANVHFMRRSKNFLDNHPTSCLESSSEIKVEILDSVLKEDNVNVETYIQKNLMI